MEDSLKKNDDNFFEDVMLTNSPTFFELDELDNFSPQEKVQADDLILTDDEFNKLLKELVILDDDGNLVDQNSYHQSSGKSVSPTVKEQDLFEVERELTYEELRIEREKLKQEKEKFANYKQEWETLRKLSEENFQAEKEKLEEQRKLEREQLYLEAKKVIDSCTNFQRYLDSYKRIYDVSK